jgi:hypothetical protein
MTLQRFAAICSISSNDLQRIAKKLRFHLSLQKVKLQRFAVIAATQFGEGD